MKRTLITISILSLLLTLCSCKTKKVVQEAETQQTVNETIQDSSTTAVEQILTKIDTSNMTVTITKTEYDTERLDSVLTTLAGQFTAGSTSETASSGTVYSHPIKSITTVTAQQRTGSSTNAQTNQTNQTQTSTERQAQETETNKAKEETTAPVAESVGTLAHATKSLFNWIGAGCLLAVLIAAAVAGKYLYNKYKEEKA